MDKNNNVEREYINQEDLLKLLPFKKTKLNQLLQANVLPVTKIGRDYITTKARLNEWLKQNEHSEIFY